MNERYDAGFEHGYNRALSSVDEILDKYNIAWDDERWEYAAPEDDWRLFRDLRVLTSMKYD